MAARSFGDVAAKFARACVRKIYRIVNDLQKPKPDVLQYFGQSFANPIAVIQGMAQGTVILGGSRALEFFVTESCTVHSDWDFYTYQSKYCVGIALQTLANAGVVWDDIFQPFRDLAAAPAGTVAYMHVSAVTRCTGRGLYEGHPGAADPEVNAWLTALEAAIDDDMYVASVEVAGRVLVISHAQNTTAYLHSPTVNIITGYTSHNGSRQKVQLIFGKKTPMQQIMAFYSSSVQCCITAYGAIHFYHDEAVERTGLIWPKNSQHQPSANSAMLKYSARGWKFTLPSGASPAPRIKQLSQNAGSKFIKFDFATGLAPQLEQARRAALDHLAWAEIDGETKLIELKSHHQRFVYGAGRKRRRHIQGRADAYLRNAGRLAFQHTVGLWAGQYSRYPEDLSGL